MTSHDVGEGLTRLARYLRLGEAPSIPSVREDEDPIRVVFEGRDTPLSAEFSVTIDLLHLREETEGRFRAAYASFSHTPDDVVEMERVLDCPVHAGASWNGWALARETWALPLRRSDPVLSGLLQRQADEAISRLPPMDGVALDVRRALASRVGGGDTRIQAIARLLATSSRSLQRRLAAAGSPISNCSIMRAGTRPNAIWRIRGCRLARSHICLAIRSPPPLTGRSGDGITRRRRRFATGNEANALECRHPLRPRSDSQPVAAIRPSLTESAIEHHADARATTTTTRTCRLKVFTASSETAATTCRSSTTGGFTGRTI